MNMELIDISIKKMLMQLVSLKDVIAEFNLNETEVKFVRAILSDMKENKETFGIYLKRNPIIGEKYKDGLIDIIITEDNIIINNSYKNPYSILGLEEMEYTKEEFLEAFEKRIKFISNQEMDYKNLKKELDETLSAYEELTKENKKHK
jgi:hypothetical protein